MGGFEVVSNTDAWSGSAESIVINSDAVFSAFKINEVDMMTTKRLTAVTFKTGMYLTTDPGVKITDFTLASGSVIVYK